MNPAPCPHSASSAPPPYNEAVPVSIAVPVYNGARYLQATLDSIARQTHRSLDIVIRDDASNDASRDIIRDFARRDSRVRTACNPATLGMVANWNKTLADCTGEWIQLVGQDDLLEPDAVETALRAARPPARLVLGARTFLFEPDARGNLQRAYRQDLPTLTSLGVGSGIVTPAFTARLIACLPNPCTNILGEPVCGLMRRDVHAERGLYQTRLSQLADYEFLLRCALNEPFVYLDRPLFTFRVHGQSATHAHHNPQNAGIALEAARFLLELLEGEAYTETRLGHADLCALWADALDLQLRALARHARRDATVAARLDAAVGDSPGLAQRLAASRTIGRQVRSLWATGYRRLQGLARVARSNGTAGARNRT